MRFTSSGIAALAAIVAAGCSIANGAAAAPMTPTSAPGAVKSFGDWEVACDNGNVCTAVSLTPQGATGTYVPMVVQIGPGPQPDMAITFTVAAIPKQQVTVFIQDEPVVVAKPSSGSLTIVDSFVPSTLMPMALAQGPIVLKTANATIGMVSVTGVSAMLRYIDATQGRAGNQSAFVATGSAPASATPNAPAAPTIRQSPIAPGRAVAAPSASAVAALRAQLCGNPVPAGTPGATAYPLDAKSTLLLVPCGSGNNSPGVTGTNMDTLAFVDQGSGPQPANFDVQPGWAYNPAFTMMENAAFDPTTGGLSDNAKRSDTDLCGVDHNYVWDGGSFRLVTMNDLDECRGGGSRMRIWQANVQQ